MRKTLLRPKGGSRAPTNIKVAKVEPSSGSRTEYASICRTSRMLMPLIQGLTFDMSGNGRLADNFPFDGRVSRHAIPSRRRLTRGT